MSFSSFLRSNRGSSRRPGRQAQLQQAVTPEVERLEGRLLLSTSRHRTTTQPSEIFSGGTVTGGQSGPSAIHVSMAKTLYGQNLLGTTTTNPLFTNSGGLQNIIVIGAPVSYINDVPQGREGNINKFSDGENLPKTSVFLDPIVEQGFQPTYNVGSGGLDDQYTTAMLEWVHGIAPLASITLVEVPATPDGVVAPADLSLGIQEAVRDAQQFGSTGPINGNPPGGVVLMGVTSRGEDATLSAMYDSLFSYKYANNVSFIAPAGEYGGTVSMPADSPWVTSVGGTTVATDTTGARTYEIASLNGGGGVSGVEPVPAFQSGIVANGKRLRTRGAIDISMAARSIQGGLDICWDPTPNATLTGPWGTFEGTSAAASMFAGMVAVANELRASNGLGVIGRDLNNELYAAYRNNPGIVHDITQGNNTLYQATAGYDLATGLGVPQANVLIPALAGVATQNAAANVVGNVTLAFPKPTTGGTATTVGNLIIPLRGTIGVEIGTQFVTLSGLNMSGSTTQTTSGTTTVVNWTATFTQTGLMSISGSSVSGTGTVTVNGDNGNTETFNVAFTGKVSGSKNRARRLNGQFFTVNSRGKKIPFGADNVFQANVSM